MFGSLCLMGRFLIDMLRRPHRFGEAWDDYTMGNFD